MESAHQQNTYSTLSSSFQKTGKMTRNVRHRKKSKTNLAISPKDNPHLPPSLEHIRETNINNEEYQQDAGEAELNVEDLETVPRAVEDLQDASLELTDCTSSIRTSLHMKHGSKINMMTQDSPRGPEDWCPMSGNTSSTLDTSTRAVALLASSDSNLTSLPTSPVTSSLSDKHKAQLEHPHSAPEAFESLGPTPRNTARKLLRKTIKMSAIKTFVGKGLDLSSSSQHQVSSSHVKVAEEKVGNRSRRREQDRDADEEAAGSTSPQPKTGVAGKMKSIFGLNGLKAITGLKGRTPTAEVLQEDDTESTEEGPLSLAKVALEDGDLCLDGGSIPRMAPTDAKLQEMARAKSKRRVKHSQRNARRSMDSSFHELGQSGHIFNEDAPSEEEDGFKKLGGRAQRKLDPEARERLRKHSESNRLRNPSAAAASRARRQQVLANAKQDSERNTVKTDQEALSRRSAHSHGGQLEKSTAMPVEEPIGKTLLRAPSREGEDFPARNSQHGETQISARKIKKQNEEQLRSRVRRSSLLAQTKEPSYSALDAIIKDNGIASIAEDSGDDETKDDSNMSLKVQDIFQIEGTSMSSNKSSSSFTLQESGRSTLGTYAPLSAQGSFQKVESACTSEYLQLKIDGLPVKESLEPHEKDAKIAKSRAAAAVVDGSKRTRRRSSSLSKLSEIQRNRGARKHGTVGEKKVGKKDGKSSVRKPRIEKNHRTHSPRRHTDKSHSRPRKAAPRGDRLDSSMPNLQTEVLYDKSTKLGASSKNHKESSSSSRSRIGSLHDIMGKLDAADRMKNGKIKEDQAAHDSKRERNRRSGKDVQGERRRVPKFTESVGGESKHSMATSVMKHTVANAETIKDGSPIAKSRRSSSLAREDITKKKRPSKRDRNEGQRVGKHAQSNPRRKNQEVKEDDASKMTSDLEKSLNQIKW